MDIFKRTAAKRLAFFVLTDILSVLFSVWIAFVLRFDYQIPMQYTSFIFIAFAVITIFLIPIFYFNRLYFFSWSYVSTNELVSLFKATSLAFIFFGIVVYLFRFSPQFSQFPRSTILISYILVFLLTGAVRLSKRIYLDIFVAHSAAEKDRTLIVGAGDTGEQILRNISSFGKSLYFPVGFLDNNPLKQGVAIHGVKVLGKISDINNVIKKYKVKKVIVALPQTSPKSVKEAVDLAREAGVKNIKVAPTFSEMIRGGAMFSGLKNVDAEDLLGRDSINLDQKQIENFIKGKKVLITGAAGSIGSELSRQVADFNPELLVLLDQDETGIFNIEGEIKSRYPASKVESFVADITDKQKMQKTFSDILPNVVFHAAAYKHVPLMEAEPDQAVKNNIFGTKILVELSMENGAEKFIFISTDKAVNPSSVMGATKRVCEMICQAYNKQEKTKFISVRFGNVLDSRGSVIPIFREQIRKRENVTVTHKDMQRYFMLTSEACLLVLQAGAMGNGGEVFVLDMGKPIKILELAKDMIRLSGYEPDKDIVITFVGMRPGEKMFEEILTAEEGTVVTQNQKIFMAKMSDVAQDLIKEHLDKLASIENGGSNAQIVQELKSITPYYK